MSNDNQNYSVGDTIVYPPHGVGIIESKDEFHGAEMFCIHFPKDRVRVRLPLARVADSPLRALASKKDLKTALKTMEGKASKKRSMWRRRAQNYETKINSGEPGLIAEVLRDLKENAAIDEQSYSERQIYRKAMERLSTELAAVEDMDERKAIDKIENVLFTTAESNKEEEKKEAA